MTRVKRQRNPYFTGLLGGVEFTVGTEATNVVPVVVQLLGPDLQPLTEPACVDWYVSDSDDGVGFASALSTGLSITAAGDGKVIQEVTGRTGKMVSSDAGEIDLDITDSGAKTVYLVVVGTGGEIYVSDAITFA